MARLWSKTTFGAKTADLGAERTAELLADSGSRTPNPPNTRPKKFQLELTDSGPYMRTWVYQERGRAPHEHPTSTSRAHEGCTKNEGARTP